jgi:hypothetical protein
LKRARAGWVLAAVTWGATVHGAPSTAATGGGPSPSAAGATAPAASPAALPPPSVTPPQKPGAAGAVPAPNAEPAPPDYAITAPSDPPPGAAPPSAADLELTEELEAARRRRERRRLLWLEEEEEREQEMRARRRRIRRELASTEAEPEPWRLVAPHFMVGVERITSLLSWRVAQTWGVDGSKSINSGTQLAFLGSSDSPPTPLVVPRLAFDGMFESGLTLGGSISYVVSSAKNDSRSATGGRMVQDGPTNTVFVLAARAGVVLPASKLVAVWLRGGFSHISSSFEYKNAATNQGVTTVTDTATFVNFTLDPQLLITPISHVAIGLGALLDIGLGGSYDSSNSTTTNAATTSAYGVTSGLVVIF